MHFQSELERLEGQKTIRRQCQQILFDYLDQSLEVTQVLLQDEDSEAIIAILGEKVEEHKTWIEDILRQAMETSHIEDYEECFMEPMELPEKMKAILLRKTLDILTWGGDLNDNALLFMSDLGQSLDTPPEQIDTLLEQFQYEKRKTFTEILRKNLNSQEKYWVARMLWDAIHIDHKVHPQEYKYFENITHLLEFDQTKIAQLEKHTLTFEILPIPKFDTYLSSYIFQYIVEIVMIDGEYSSEEAKFINTIGNALGYDDDQQDEIIQPIASALMLRRSLF